MDQNEEITGRVRSFYDQVGWQPDQKGMYQNASYEDLRPVSREYIHQCHLRINRHLAKRGEYLLDAGSGPVQYPEYETYSADYKRRVCMDLSIVALVEARKRLGEKGLYVVGDISWLPFKKQAFDGIVSLHTIHHLPITQKVAAYDGLFQCLKPGRSMVTVDGWGYSPLISFSSRFYHKAEERLAKDALEEKGESLGESAPDGISAEDVLKELNQARAGTFVQKLDAKWLKSALNGRMPFKILVWRSVSTRFLRTMIQAQWHGRFWLRVIYCLEELFPRILGENGQYPMLVVKKPAIEHRK